MVKDEIQNSLKLPKKRFSKPPFIVTFGLPYTGKTEISKYLADKYNLVWMSTDWIRIKFHFSDGPSTHKVMYEVASDLINQGIGVVFDGIHLGEHNREDARNFALENSATPILIYTTCSQELIDSRMKQRCANPKLAYEQGKHCVTPEHFRQIASFLEKPTKDEGVLVVDTTEHSPEQNLVEIEPILDKILL